MSEVNEPLVSVVIPCFNAELYIFDTVNSILNQTVDNVEIIIVNDGSTDKSLEIINAITDDRVKVINQNNAGVSAARNNGMKISTGQFIIFFDADDLMPPDFIEQRLKIFYANNFDFVCGYIHFFIKKNDTNMKRLRGTYKNIEEEVLLYSPEVATCPSNYMFKINSLRANNLTFNTILNSSADRFFLLELSKNMLNGTIINSGGELFYRVHENSMSHKVSHNLVNDSINYYSELLKSNLIPDKIKNEALSKGYYLISGTYFKLKSISFLFYALLSFYYSPKLFFKNIKIKLLCAA